jgi:hypothetical protein
MIEDYRPLAAAIVEALTDDPDSDLYVHPTARGEHQTDLVATVLQQELGAASGWQPIETAPRDSTHVLLFRPSRDDPARQTVMEGWWSIPYEAAPREKGWWQTMGGVMLSADVHLTSDGLALGATHWAPLPPPPHVDV